MEIKRNSNNTALFTLLFIYIVYVFCYGIVVKLTIANDAIFAFKTYVPEILLAMTVVVTFFTAHKSKVALSSFLIITYEILVVIINLLSHGITEQSLYFMRDLLIPLIASVFYQNVVIDHVAFDKFKSVITIFSKIYLLLGCALIVVEQLCGWKWTSAFYTGHSFYGQDTYSKIIVAQNFGLLRAPSLSGNFSSFSEYCLICICFIFSQKKSNLNFMFWYIITVICCVLSTNKSVIITLAIITFIMFIYNYKTKKFYAGRFIVSIIAVLSVLMILLKSSIFSLNTYMSQQTLTGFFDRFNGWKEIFTGQRLPELLIPYNAFLYGSGSQVQSVTGVFSYWDNAYFYMLFIQGILGMFLWIWYIRKLYVRQKRYGDSKNAVNLLMILLIMGITSNVVQGRAYFTFFLLLMPLGSCLTDLDASIPGVQPLQGTDENIKSYNSI